MRRLWIILVLILVSASAATGVKLHALTECERWIAEYRDALKHSPTVQRANAARHRILHHYVKHKTVSARPRVLPARYRRPKMSREEALHKMEFACGDLGLEDPAPTVLVANPVPQFLPASEEESGAPSNLVAQNTAPSPGGSGFPVWGVPAAPMFPGGGGGGGTTPGGGGGTTPGGGGGGDTPVPPPPPPPPPAQTPEPGTLVLMATGLMGAAGMLRRRIADRS